MFLFRHLGRGVLCVSPLPFSLFASVSSVLFLAGRVFCGLGISSSVGQCCFAGAQAVQACPASLHSFVPSGLMIGAERSLLFLSLCFVYYIFYFAL